MQCAKKKSENLGPFRDDSIIVICGCCGASKTILEIFRVVLFVVVVVAGLVCLLTAVCRSDCCADGLLTAAVQSHQSARAALSVLGQAESKSKQITCVCVVYVLCFLCRSSSNQMMYMYDDWARAKWRVCRPIFCHVLSNLQIGQPTSFGRRRIARTACSMHSSLHTVE